MDESKDLTYSTNYEYNEKGFLISEIRNRESLNKSNFWDGNKYEYEIVNGVDKLRRIKKLTNPINESEFTELFGGEITYDQYGIKKKKKFHI